MNSRGMNKANVLVAPTRHLNRPAIVSSGHGHRQACCKPSWAKAPALSPVLSVHRGHATGLGRPERGGAER
jgi:hypothetical protein